MNNNENNYKNAINQIHASEELKEKTINKMKESKKSKAHILRYLSAVAVILIVFCIGIFEVNDVEEGNFISKPVNEKDIAKVNNNLPRFKNMEELKEVLKENYSQTKRDIMINDAIQLESSVESSNKEMADFSKTNVQVNNVDEADIVKTDGDFIYYVTLNCVFVVNAKEMNQVSKIEISGEKERFSPVEVFINGDKLIVLGNYYEYEENIERDTEENSKIRDYVAIRSKNSARAIIYDISNKEDLKIVRTIDLDGNYRNARMIKDNIYMISSKYMYYYDGIKEEEILPRMNDSLNEEKIIECTDIAYFKGTDNNNYMLVGGFNINNSEPVNVETFFGAGNDIYANENNLYITQTEYNSVKYYNSNTIIYKFELNNSQISLKTKGTVEGYINNQFSMDEYEGNLRIATTYRIGNNTKKDEEIEELYTTNINEIAEANRLYILDENLNEMGRIDNLAKDEKIYSVRFVGKIGYIVTFKQVDPLFVIDLSDPRNPQVKGELKIPGYSSYLHPYDENHIIGIGYNTKDNGHGGVTNYNMKMSMFDVSDLENPKELYNINIGDSYTYSELMYNHKALFYKKSENLIGFPISSNKNKFVLFKIDLENGFEKYGEIENSKYYSILRAIYIENILYSLEYDKITSYRLDNLEKIKEVNFENETDFNNIVLERTYID